MVGSGVRGVKVSTGRMSGWKDASMPRAWICQSHSFTRTIPWTSSMFPWQTGIATVAAGLGDAEIFLHGLVGPEGDHLVPGQHDLLGGDIPEPERANHDLVDEGVRPMHVAGVAQDILELVGRETMLPSDAG